MNNGNVYVTILKNNDLAADLLHGRRAFLKGGIPLHILHRYTNRMSKLETAEWTNIWYGNTNIKRKILLLGDSITQGYHYVVQREFGNDICVGMHTTSKAVDNIYLIKEIEIMVNQYGNANFELVHVNNGIHGMHMTDSEYAQFFDMYVYQLTELLPSSKFVLALSTPITEPGSDFRYAELNERIINRNKIVEEVGEKYNIYVEDLYSVADGIAEIRTGDGYHYKPEGCEKLGMVVVNTIKNML